MPTPAVAYLTRTFRAEAGIVISASHNPYYDNGIKFFSADGTKLDDQLEMAIEAELEKPMGCVESELLGKATRIDDAAGRYIEFCKASLPSKTRLSGIRVIVDCANGATYHIAPNVFRELGAEVIARHDIPDGVNINLDCGSTEPTALQADVKAERADAGIALDGDGDRLIMVDHKGEIVDGDELLFIIAMAEKRAGTGSDDIVGTLMSNLGLEHALKEQGMTLHRANVGDRYVIAMLKETGGQVGGESSGHIICLDKTTTGDGIVAALQILAEMQETGSSLHELHSKMTKYPQCLINVNVKKKIDLENNMQVTAAVNAIEKSLGDDGRVLLRASGTEPVIRVMIEGRDVTQTNQLA